MTGVAELKEDGQVSCDTAHNPALNLFVHYATRPRRSPAARRRLDLLGLLLQLLALDHPQLVSEASGMV